MAGPERVGDAVPSGLCRRHAAELTPLDTALGDLVNSTRELDRLRTVRAQVRKNWPAHRLTVDGPRIERAILKMVMSHAVARKQALEDWQPPARLPNLVFGGEPLKAGCGLAVVVRVGDTLVDREQFGFTFGKSVQSVGYDSVLLELRHGLRLLCTWETPVHSLGELRIGTARYDAASDALWHPRRVSFANGALDLGISLDFDWSGKWTDNKHRAVAGLREKFAPPIRK